MSVPEEWPPRSAFGRGHTEPGLQAGWHFCFCIEWGGAAVPKVEGKFPQRRKAGENSILVRDRLRAR